MNKKTVLMILVDGMRHDYINSVDSPFLYSLGKQNIEAIVRETFAFELRPAFFAGLQPEECDVANMFCYNPTDSPFRSIDVSHRDRTKITTELRAEAERRGYSLVKHIGGCAEIPLELLKYFDFAEKYHTADPGSIPGHKTLFDYLLNDKKKWLWIGYPDGPNTTDGVSRQFFSAVTGEEDFIYLHFSELDWVGHEFGPNSTEQKRTLTEIDEAIRQIFCKLNQSFAGVHSVIFGDHGQVEIKKNINIEAEVKKTGLVIEKDYLYFLDSTQARFWFFNDAAKEKVIDLLQTIPDGRTLTQTDYKRLHSRYKHNKFGELIFVVNDGVGIFPNFFQQSNPCKGLHGYLPEVEGNWAKLIIAGCGINKKITSPVEMTNLFPTLLELLGYNKPLSLKTQSVFDRENIKLLQEKYKLSIVIPTHNRLKTFKKCLSAIEKQNYPQKNFELIVVNDGSSDGTDNFLKKYQANTKINFKYFNQMNAGPATARNVGIKHAEGHIIILIGDDMIAEPDFLKNHSTFHQEHPPVSHACLGFIDWSRDIKKTPLMDLITSKDGGQQFCWHLIENQDCNNIDWSVFWSSNISFKRAFSLTHGLFNDEIVKHAMWEDVELGHRLHRAGLVLHFRKGYRVYHDHAVTLRSFVERQRMVGWYNHDLSDLGVSGGYHLAEFEKNRVYSKKILDKICSIILESSEDVKRSNEDRLKRVYNFSLRYAALVGYVERKGELIEELEGSFGLLYNLALAEFALAERDGQITSLNQSVAERDQYLAERDGQITNLNQAVAERDQSIVSRDSQIANLNQAVAERDQYLAERDEQITNLNQAVAERDGQIASLNQSVAERDQYLAERDGQITSLNKTVALHDAHLTKIISSRSWRITRPLRFAARLLRGQWDVTLASLHKTFGDSHTDSLNKLAVNPPEAPATLCDFNTAGRLDIPTSAPGKRILLVSYYCPSRAHAGGLRILDIYSLIKSEFPTIGLDLYTFRRPEVDWSYDDVESIFDNIYYSDTEELSVKGLLHQCKERPCYAVIDLQFHQAARHIDAFRALGGKILFTPIESLARSFFIDVKEALYHAHRLPFKDIAAGVRNAIEELKYCFKADEAICVSKADATLLRTISRSRKIKYMESGISDIEFKNALSESLLELPPREKENIIVYVAFFGSQTNILALKWYLDKAHPLIKTKIPDYKLHVVGRGDLSVFAGYQDEAVIFFGAVPSLGPYINEAKVGIAPALGGSGLRGKMSQYAIYGVPCVASPIAVKGSAYEDGVDIYITEVPEIFAERCITLLKNKETNKRIGDMARQTMLRHYTWKSKLDIIRKVYALYD